VVVENSQGQRYRGRWCCPGGRRQLHHQPRHQRHSISADLQDAAVRPGEGLRLHLTIEAFDLFFATNT
jgi:hypothetical protein